MMATQLVYERRPGWVTFAAIVMFAVGFLRIISAISYFANSHKINQLSNGLFSSHLWAWGLWDLLIAVLALCAGVSLLGGGSFGRVIAYIWGVLVIDQSFVIIGQPPWDAAASIDLAPVVIYGLARSEWTEEGSV